MTALACAVISAARAADPDPGAFGDQPYTARKAAEYPRIHSDACGALLDMITTGDHAGCTLVSAVNIKPTRGHYHPDFTEVYLVASGRLELKLYDPATRQMSEASLGPNELCIIRPGIHHKIVSASDENLLYVIATPAFTSEVLSDVLK